MPGSLGEEDGILSWEEFGTIMEERNGFFLLDLPLVSMQLQDFNNETFTVNQILMLACMMDIPHRLI